MAKENTQKIVAGRGGKEEAAISLAYKTGGERQGRVGQGAEKMKEERGQSVQVIVVQAWDLELQNKTILQGKRLNQQNPKTRGNAI